MSNAAIGPDRILALALAIASSMGLAACGKAAPQEGGDRRNREAPEITTANAEARDEPVTLTLDGTLLADEESHVTSVVPGRVVEVMVERGSVVEEGAPLVRLRDVDYRLQAQAAQAQLEQARARLGMSEADARAPAADTLPDVVAARSNADLAQSTLERTEELARRGVLSAQALDEARSRAASAREQYATALNNARASIASLTSARTTLNQARTSAAEATVRAPFAGEIAVRSVSVGEYVAPQTALVTLVRTDPLRIELEVPQQHLTAVRTGQTVRLSVDAMPDRSFEATVRYVSAAVDAATRSLVVEAVIPNSDRLLRPGLFATARLETGGSSAVAVVPPQAVLNQAGVDRVFVVRDDTIEERVVTVARRSNDEVVIGSGLAGGETVATNKLDQLADGMSVRVQATARTSAEAPTERRAQH